MVTAVLGGYAPAVVAAGAAAAAAAAAAGTVSCCRPAAASCGAAERSLLVGVGAGDTRVTFEQAQQHPSSLSSSSSASPARSCSPPSSSSSSSHQAAGFASWCASTQARFLRPKTRERCRSAAFFPVRNRHSLVSSAFPMFVPSLSW